MELYLPIETTHRSLKTDLQRQLIEARKIYRESAEYSSFEKLKETYNSRDAIKNKELNVSAKLLHKSIASKFKGSK